MGKYTETLKKIVMTEQQYKIPLRSTQ